MALLFEWRPESVCRVELDAVDTTLFLGESMRTERLKSGAGCRIEKGNRGRAEIFALPSHEKLSDRTLVRDQKAA